MKNLRKIRQSKNITQLSLGMKIDVAQETVSAYESGKTYPNVETLLKICDVLNTSADFILDRTEVPQPVNDLLISNLTAEELELTAMFRRLSAEKKSRLIGYLEGLCTN